MHKDYLPVIQETVQFSPDDVIADIGGGTGWYSHQFWKIAGVKEPVMSVDPCAEMLEKAKEREGVRPVHATAEQFFSNPPEKLLTKVFIIEAVHHFTDPVTVFKQMWNRLAPGGCCVVLALPPENEWPSFSAEKALDKKLNRTDEDTMSQLRDAGFNVESKKVTTHHKISKAHWYKMLRGKFTSALHHFTDAEVEEGIQELEKEKFHQLKDDDIITIDDVILIILARKDKA